MNVGYEIKEFKDCHIEADIYSNAALTFPANSTCDNSTIVIQGTSQSKIFKNVKLTNNCEIVFVKYNDTKKMVNDHSTLGTDYTVEYLGEEILN
jgi:predicted transcriptional regulator